MIKYLSLFSGIGAFEKALQRLQIPFELIGYCEIEMNEDKNIMFLGNIYPTKTRKNPNQGRVYDPKGIAPTLNCKGGQPGTVYFN